MIGFTASVDRSSSSLQRDTAPGGLRKKYLESEKHAIPPNLQRRELSASMDLDTLLKSPLVPGPDIKWNPSFDTYRARVETLSNLDLPRPKTVPEGFPEVIEAPWVWDGSEFADERSYLMFLDNAEILEIESALAHFKDLPGNYGPEAVSCSTFPLPGLRAKLQRIAVQIHSGSGFVVIRGLEPRRYSSYDNVILYLGITSYIAEKRGCQDSDGNMISKYFHVKDLGYQIPNSKMRQSPFASNAQPFHTDVCDILAMYVQEQAAEGGDSHLASCAKIYNEIAAERPDVIHTLADRSWMFDKHQVPAFWNTRALLFNFEIKGPGFCFSRRPITGSPTSPRSPGVPPMTEIQAEALDMVHFKAVKNSLSMRLKRGDIQLLNNLAVFHARSGFRDSVTQKRHIIRLWLRNEDLAWKTPAGLQKTWNQKYGESDWKKRAKWNIEPGQTLERVLYRSESCS